VAQTVSLTFAMSQQDLALPQCVWQTGVEGLGQSCQTQAERWQKYNSMGHSICATAGTDHYLDCVLGLACLVRHSLVIMDIPRCFTQAPGENKQGVSRAVSQEVRVKITQCCGSCPVPCPYSRPWCVWVRWYVHFTTAKLWPVGRSDWLGHPATQPQPTCLPVLPTLSQPIKGRALLAIYSLHAW